MIPQKIRGAIKDLIGITALQERTHRLSWQQSMVILLPNFTFWGEKGKEMLKEGIYDNMQAGDLDGILPKEYYRLVFQSKAYTVREYSQYFEILDYIERGAANIHDLIVMRKRK
jgi:hypothetical protein